MIISRYNVPLINLYNNQPEIKKLIDDFFEDKTVDEHLKECYREPGFCMQTLNQRDIGWCAPHNYLSRLLDICDELDKVSPYDDGFDLCNVNKVYSWTDHDSDTRNEIELELCFSDGSYDYVLQRVKLIYNNGEFEVRKIE